jgi:hypothetical protein
MNHSGDFDLPWRGDGKSEEAAAAAAAATAAGPSWW